MQETSLHFYYFKIRLIVQVLLFFPFMIGSYYIAYIGFTELSLYPILLGLFTSILVSCVYGADVLKLFRRSPYVTITNTYIRLDPQTKSEVTLYYDDIKFIDISEASFQKLIKIFVYDEKTLFKQLSLHNKIRLGPNALFGFKTFPIAYNSIRKRDRPQLLATLDKIMAYKENQTSENLIINDINHEPVDSQQYYMERYGLEPPTVLIIDAVIRNLEFVGEAAKRVSQDLREQYL